jgi:hypothetical protein
LTFLVDMKASEVEEENRPSPTASISRGGFGLPLLLRFFAELSNPQRDIHTSHSQ